MICWFSLMVCFCSLAIFFCILRIAEKKNSKSEQIWFPYVISMYVCFSEECLFQENNYSDQKEPRCSPCGWCQRMVEVTRVFTNYKYKRGWTRLLGSTSTHGS